MSLRPDLPDKYVKANGFNIRYIEKGSGQPLVCIHGLNVALSADQWLVNIDTFSQFAHVYAIDMPGWGLSDLPAEGYSFPMWIETIKGFCDALGLDKVDIMGQSMGGWYAALYAHQYPERVRRVVLVGNAGLNPSPPAAASQFTMPDKERLRAILYNEWREFHPITDDMVEELWRRMQMPGRETAYRTLLHYIHDPANRQEYSLRERLPQMQMPILISWGDNARGIRLQYALEAFVLAPNARLQVTYGGDHSSMGFTAREFEVAATKFLTEPEVKPAEAKPPRQF